MEEDSSPVEHIEEDEKNGNSPQCVEFVKEGAEFKLTRERKGV
jgi:hypothetical protein